MANDSILGFLKPVLWLAIAAFLVGFTMVLASAGPKLIAQAEHGAHEDVQLFIPEPAGWSGAKRI